MTELKIVIVRTGGAPSTIPLGMSSHSETRPVWGFGTGTSETLRLLASRSHDRRSASKYGTTKDSTSARARVPSDFIIVVKIKVRGHHNVLFFFKKNNG